MIPIGAVLLAAALSASLSGEMIAPSALNSLSAFPAGIVSAPVYDQNGQAVGTVTKIQAEPSGKPLAIAILPTANQNTSPVIVSAAAASYDKSRNMVVVSSDALPTRPRS